MAVQYKFKSAKDFDSVPIDEHCISIGRLKDKILSKLKLGNASSDFDLVVSNPDTDEEYLDEEFLVEENTSVLVRRVPRKAFPVQQNNTDAGSPIEQQQPAPCITTDEDVRIKEFVDSSAADWLRQTNENSTAPRGAGGAFQKKVPHQGYICHRCGVAGHFIQHCPTNGDPSFDVKKMKAPSGIPRTMLVANPDGSYALPNGETAAMEPNEDAFAKEIEGVIPSECATEVPAELRCPLCQDALRDAVLTSKCCFKSYCDPCIRNVLLEKTTCVCGAKNIRADDLLPNKTLRETVYRLLSGSPLPMMNTAAEKPQSQDSTTTTHVDICTVDEKTDEAKDEFEDVEEVDYDEEGFDDVNDELEPAEGQQENSEKTPESDAKQAPEADEDDKPPEDAPEKKEEIPHKQETKLELEPAKRSSDDRQAVPRRRPDDRGNPYAVQYTGYWSASQMIGDACRPPFGYPGYFPGCFPAPTQFPFQSFPGHKPGNRILSRKEFEARKADMQRNRGHMNRNRGRDEPFHQMPDRRGGRQERMYRPRSKTPPRRRRSRSPDGRDRQRHHSGSPARRERETMSPPKFRRRSPSPVRRGSPPRRRQTPPLRSLRSKSQSPPPQRNAVNRNPPPKQARRDVDTGHWSPQRYRRYGPKADEKMPAKEVRESFVSREHGRMMVDVSPPLEREMLYDEPKVGRSPERYIPSASRMMVTRRAAGGGGGGGGGAAAAYIDDDMEEPLVRKTVPVSRMRPLQQRARPGGLNGVELLPGKMKTKSVLRAARGASAELPEDVFDEDDGVYRRYIDEDEEAVPVRRPVVTAAAAMQRKRMMLARRRRGGVPVDDEYDDEEAVLEPVPPQRVAVFDRLNGFRQRCFDEDEEEEEEEEEDGHYQRNGGEWVVHRTSNACMPRKRQRAPGPARAKAMNRRRMEMVDDFEQDDEYDEFDDEEHDMEGNEEEDDEEFVAPPRPSGAVMKRRRLLAKQRAMLQPQQQQRQQMPAANHVSSRSRRKRMRVGQGNGGAGEPGAHSNVNGDSSNNQCKLVKSVFERISFGSTTNTNKAGRKFARSGAGAGAGNGGGKSGASTGPRMVVFYGDVS